VNGDPLALLIVPESVQVGPLPEEQPDMPVGHEPLNENVEVPQPDSVSVEPGDCPTVQGPRVDGVIVQPSGAIAFTLKLGAVSPVVPVATVTFIALPGVGVGSLMEFAPNHVA
jgi:hypothetical protein